MNEKLGPCPFCNGTRITATAWYADTRLPGAAEPKTSQADFCPKCGRPLTEEAVNAANESLTLGFDVIDTQTGEYPKIREISRKEEEKRSGLRGLFSAGWKALQSARMEI